MGKCSLYYTGTSAEIRSGSRITMIFKPGFIMCALINKWFSSYSSIFIFCWGVVVSRCDVQSPGCCQLCSFWINRRVISKKAQQANLGASIIYFDDMTYFNPSSPPPYLFMDAPMHSYGTIHKLIWGNWPNVSDTINLCWKVCQRAGGGSKILST